MQVLIKLIPAVISSLKSPHNTTRMKVPLPTPCALRPLFHVISKTSRQVLEILAHVNKRVKGQPIKLPLRELLPLAAVSAEPAPELAMVRSFALVYLEMASERSAAAERMEAVAPLLSGLSMRPPQHRAICLRLALAALEGMAGAPVVLSAAGETDGADVQVHACTPRPL